MGIKKIKTIFKKRGIYDSNKKSTNENVVGLKDLRHDLENQLIQINQKLENLKRKNYSSNPKPLKQQYLELCSNYYEDTADAMIFIDRTVYQMFCEMACMTILDGKSEKINEYKSKHKVKIHKILMRMVLLYSDELSKNNIRYDVCPSEEEWDISEYVFSAIILKIIENCTKYCKKESILKITISKNKISFGMQSLKIEYSERTKIFENEFSGKQAIKLGKSSSGKGLFHARELAKFHELDLGVIAGTEITTFNELLYSDNEFYLRKI